MRKCYPWRFLFNSLDQSIYWPLTTLLFIHDVVFVPVFTLAYVFVYKWSRRPENKDKP